MTVKSCRSLKASMTGIRRANRAVMMFATKIDLAAELEISRATVQNFFAGKPVGRENFHKICSTLKLPWNEVADLVDETELVSSSINLKTNDSELFEIAPEFSLPLLGSMPANSPDQTPTALLRQHLRAQIQQQCGSLRVLDMTQPMPLQQIYIDVDLLTKVNRHRRIGISELHNAIAESPSNTTDLPGIIRNPHRSSFNYIPQETMPALRAIERSQKLLILGKPGAGKTTLLKQITLQCIEGNLHPDRVPLFISLKDFAETEEGESLLEYIQLCMKQAILQLLS
jgi:predicted NACHT family NTPase